MNALLRALTDSRGIENIEQALGMPDITSDAMRRAIDGWFDAWFSRVPPDEEDPCQRIPYAVVNKLGKAVFAEYDSSLQNTGTPKLQYLDRARQAFDAKKRELLQWCMVGGETWAKPVFAPDGLTWQVIRRDAVLILGRAPDGRVTDLACCEKSVVADRQYYTLVERRTTGPDGRLTIENRLYQADNKATLGRRVPLQSLAQYERLADAYTYPAPLDGLGLVALKMPTVNCVDGSPDGVAVYEPAMGLIHNINRNEYQLAREFELGRMRIAASADLLTAENGRKRLRDDLFVGLEGSEQTVGITAFAPALRNENYEARRQAYLKAVENLLGVKRGILSDAEAVSKTATEINSSAGDYSLSIIEFQNLYYDALQAALRLADQLGQAYRLCDGTAWDTEVLNVTWGNGVLYDADKEWADRLAMVQQGMLRPELALAWKFDLPCDTEEDLAAIRQKYMPTMRNVFEGDWEAAWQVVQDAVSDIWDVISDRIRGAINNIIGFVNGMISAIVSGLNTVINGLNSLSFDAPSWVTDLTGISSFGFNIGTVTAPQIPYLAQGAVIPANREFLAVLGDQSHGTNVEAPLDTIKQAVAEVMEDLQAGQMAGFEAVVSVLREILSAVYGIELTDEDVGRAVQRWQRKQAIATGGV